MFKAFNIDVSVTTVRTNIKLYVKHLNYKLYYQQLHLKYLCNLATCLLQIP